MDDDFNTPQALAVLFELAREINRFSNHHAQAALATTLKYLGSVLGLFEQPADVFLKNSDEAHPNDLQFIEEIINQRSEARCKGEWVRADQLRDELSKQGVELEDVGAKTSWRFR